MRACICASLLPAGLAHCHLLPPRSEHSGSPDSPRTLSSSRRAPSAPWEPLTLRPDREDRAPAPGRKHHEEDGSQGFAASPSEYRLVALANTSVTWRNKQGVVRPPLREACPSCLSVCNLHHSLLLFCVSSQHSALLDPLYVSVYVLYQMRLFPPRIDAPQDKKRECLFHSRVPRPKTVLVTQTVC